MNEGTMRYLASRRRFLRDAAFTSLGLVAAACAPTGGPTGKGKKGGEFHAAWPYDLPPKGEWNAFGGNTILSGSYLQEILYPTLATYHWIDKKWEYYLAESHTVTSDKVEAKLRSGLKWDDGKPVTSKDVASTFWIGRMTGFGIWNFADDLETPDERTIRFKLKKASALAERQVLRISIRPDAVYGEFAARARDLFKAGKTPTSDEVKALRKELTDLKVAAPSSAGPYKIDPSTLTEAQVTMTRNPNGLFADRVNFDKIVIFNGETAQVTPLVLAGDVDYATHFFPVATEKAFVDNGLRIARGPLFTGPALYFHWTSAPEFQDPRLRQAVAFAVDRSQANKIAYGETTRAPKWCAGFSDVIVESWLSADDQRKLTDYSYNTSKAEQLMKDAGWAKGTDGVWQKGGKKLEYDMQFPSDFADWSAVATNVADQLNKFGIKATLKGAVRSQQGPDFLAGRFTLSFNAWGFSGNPHPQPSLIRPVREFNVSAAGGGQKYPMQQKSAQGDVDFEALLDQAAELDEARQKDAVRKLAFAFNELLPCVPLAERFNNAPLNDKARVGGWPPDTDPIYKNGAGDNFLLIMLMDGTLGAK